MSTELTPVNFPDLNYGKILTLLGLTNGFKIFIQSFMIQLLFELGFRKYFTYEFYISQISYLKSGAPFSLILLGYLCDKIGASNTVRYTLFASSIFTILLALSNTLSDVHIISICLGLTYGLEAIVYSITAKIYSNQYLPFAFALLFISNMISSLIFEVFAYSFEGYRNIIPNEWTIKYLFLIHPKLFTALIVAIIISLFAVFSNILIPEEKEKSIIVESQVEEGANETTTLIGNNEPPSYNSISQRVANIYQYPQQIYQTTSSLLSNNYILISAYALHCYLVYDATRSLEEWYRTPIERGGLGLGFGMVFPALYYSLAATYYLAYLYLPSTFTRYSPKSVFFASYQVGTISLLTLLVYNFLPSLLWANLFNLLIGIEGVILIICQVFADLSLLLMISNTTKINLGFLFGISLGLPSAFILLSSVYFGNLFGYFSDMNYSWFNTLNPSLLVYSAIAVVNYKLAKILNDNEPSILF